MSRAGAMLEFERPWVEGEDDERDACRLCGRRVPKWPPACRLCRSRFPARLWELRDLWALLPAALGPGRADVQRVSGSREKPLPLRAGAVDLAGPPRRDVDGVSDAPDVLVPKVLTGEPEWQRAVFYGSYVWQQVRRREVVAGAVHPSRCRCGNPELHAGRCDPVLVSPRDQAGTWGVAAVLDSWVRDWAARLDEPLPPAEVPELVAWLAKHLTWAINEHPAIVDFHNEMTTLLYACRALLNVSRAPIHLDEACPTCGLTALTRDPGGGDVECGHCRRTWQVRDFPRLAVVLASEEEVA